MKAGEIIDAIERFFLDLIGTVVPGALLLIGWWFLFGIPRVPGGIGQVDGYVKWSGLIVLGYVLGHFVTGAGMWLTKPGGLTRLARRWSVSAVFVRAIKSEQEVFREVAERSVYTAFVRRATQTMPWLSPISETDVHEWRNIAMSLLTPQENHTIYRFMFISLLNLGAFTVGVLLAMAWGVSWVATWLQVVQPWGTLLFPDRRPFDVSIAVVGGIVCWFFLERRASFYPLSLRVPFSMAIVKLDKATAAPTVSAARLLPSVYLAGGSRSSWQDVASERLSGWNIIDPRTHQLSDEHAYTAWDLEGIRRSDWVLANFEATNPGGYNLALEVGYAKALGKRIILIDEKGSADPSVRRYTSMLHACSDFTPQSLDEAISFLQKLISIA